MISSPHSLTHPRNNDGDQSDLETEPDSPLYINLESESPRICGRKRRHRENVIDNIDTPKPKRTKVCMFIYLTFFRLKYSDQIIDETSQQIQNSTIQIHQQ